MRVEEEHDARNGVVEVHEASVSTGNSRSIETKDQEKEKKEKDVKPQTVAFYKLFSFADSRDHVMMVIGTIGAMGNGVCMPLMTILMGELIDSFGQNQNTDKTLEAVTSVSSKLNLNSTALL